MATITQQFEYSPLQAQPVATPFQPLSVRIGSDRGPLHAFHLRADGLLVEQRPGGLEFTRVRVRGHRRASLTVSDPVDLLGWECPACEALRSSVEAGERFDVVEARLVIGRR